MIILIYLAALIILFGAALGVARELGLSVWAAIGCGAALTLRHRILLTGVNTLESYAHPRMMAFALGIAATLPFVAVAVTLAVQLQVSRLFWMLDLLATVYAAWAVFDGPLLMRGKEKSRRWPACAALALACLALVRGIYSMRIGHPERPMFQIQLPRDDWRDAMAWLRRTPKSAHVLADPGRTCGVTAPACGFPLSAMCTWKKSRMREWPSICAVPPCVSGNGLVLSVTSVRSRRNQSAPWRRVSTSTVS